MFCEGYSLGKAKASLAFCLCHCFTVCKYLNFLYHIINSPFWMASLIYHIYNYKRHIIRLKIKISFYTCHLNIISSPRKWILLFIISPFCLWAAYFTFYSLKGLLMGSRGRLSEMADWIKGFSFNIQMTYWSWRINQMTNQCPFVWE